MGLTGAVMAQTPTNDSTSRVLGDDPRQHRSGERNILGAPVYYDTLGNRLGETHATDSLYRRPKHHYMNRLESEFHSFFLEYSTLFTSYDVAIGAKLSYVPQRWGFYGSLMAGINHAYVTLGPVLRLSDCGDIIDWHLYGGFALSRRLGSEIGIRIASAESDEFCWTSLSMGLGYVNHHSYFTIGLSLSLLPNMLFIFW